MCNNSCDCSVIYSMLLSYQSYVEAGVVAVLLDAIRASSQPHLRCVRGTACIPTDSSDSSSVMAVLSINCVSKIMTR
jgi:hypothetical protein